MEANISFIRCESNDKPISFYRNVVSHDYVHDTECARCPAMDWQPIQGLFQPRTKYSWDRVQIHGDSESNWIITTAHHNLNLFEIFGFSSPHFDKFQLLLLLGNNIENQIKRWWTYIFLHCSLFVCFFFFSNVKISQVLLPSAEPKLQYNAFYSAKHNPFNVSSSSKIYCEIFPIPTSKSPRLSKGHTSENHWNIWRSMIIAGLCEYADSKHEYFIMFR